MPRESGVRFEMRVAEALRAAGIQFEMQPPVGGLRPDFIVKTPLGRTLVIEAKAWKPSPENKARAAEQAKYYAEAIGADRGFVVLPELDKGDHMQGLVSLDQLIPELKQEFERPPGSATLQMQPETNDFVFAAMPFSPEYDDVYLVAMTYAARKVDATCVRVDLEEFSGDVVEEIKKLIRGSIAVIADLSDGHPNVLYEVGFAHALEIPSVHVASTDLARLPFDVRNWNTIKYEKGRTTHLKRRLARRLKTAVT